MLVVSCGGSLVAQGVSNEFQRTRAMGRSSRSDGGRGAKQCKVDPVAAAMKSVLPKKRSGYAIFLSERYAKVKAEMKDQDGRVQRAVVSKVSQAWNDLDDDARAWCQNRAKEEAQAQKEAAERLFPNADDKPAEVACGHETTVGDYVLSSKGEEIWKCTNVAAFHACHRVLRSRALALVFKDQNDFQKELQILKMLMAQTSETFYHELYLKALHLPEESAILKCIVQENFPALHACSREQGFLEHRLVVLAQQLARGLLQLQRLGYYHGDVRPKAIYWSEGQMTCKLSRFARCVKIGDQMEVQPYCGPYRAPEMWNCLVPTAESEVWAFACTLLESCVGHDIFTDVEQMVYFDSTSDVTAMESCPAFKEVPAAVRFVLLRFMQAGPSKRMSLEKFLASPNLSGRLADKL